MADSSDSQKIAAWLGIVVSLIAVLAFFGIDSWDDLKRTMSRDGSETAEACKLAKDALAYTSTPRGGVMLQNASNATDDEELRNRLREAATAHLAFHRAWEARAREINASRASRASEAAEAQVATTGDEADRTQKRWIAYCEEHGSAI
ncbi:MULTISPECIES: hypothetical protein [unclassified Streptomyces]|uniref:hypothetical protein n=1 Tax=unclassified Streptomyces TaxID=2593676 RepID=UPI000BF313BF|nr:hypothetical protein [Streptomyces sp. Ru87]PGH50763.1 hypothetical protein CRI70_10180 [Streptomyces sp. Ru87]